MTRAGRMDRTTGRVSLAALRRREKGLRMRLYWLPLRNGAEAAAIRTEIAELIAERRREEARRAAAKEARRSEPRGA